MTSLNARLVLSAVGIALLATPAFAQHRRPSPLALYDHQYNARGMRAYAAVLSGDPATGYPNPVTHSGSAAQVQSGAAFDLDRGY
jgi:hypothetical protein